MGLRQREWARRTRDSLRTALGGKCVDCCSTFDLEFDVVKPVPERHHRIEWSARMSFYRRQYAAGNLALRCAHCNGFKQDKIYPEPSDNETPETLSPELPADPNNPF